MKGGAPDGLRLATLVDLLDGLDDIPVAVLDNKSKSVCYANPCFKKLCGSDDKERQRFLESVQEREKELKQQERTASVTWQGKQVRVSWEASIEGDPGHDSNAWGQGDEQQRVKNSNDTQDPKKQQGNTDNLLISVPLIQTDEQHILAAKATPMDQGLDANSELDTQLERSVWQCLLTEIPAACLIMDTHGRVRFASRTLSEIFCIPKSSGSWENVSSLPSGCVGFFENGKQMSKEDYPMYKTVKHREVVRGAEFRIKRADGSFGSIRSTSSPIYDKNKDVVAIVAVIEDVSSAYDDKVENARLKAQHDAIAHANKLKDQFISSVSHELRTPLNGLLGLHDLISREESHEERERNLAQMADLSERMRVVVDDLLSVTLDNGRLEPEIAPHDLKEMLLEVLDSCLNAARYKGVSLKVHPPVDPTFPKDILTDRREWKGIMHRLLDNAIKYSDSGSAVHLSLQVQQEENKNYVVIRVADQGRGIADTEKIFDAFWQEDSNITLTTSSGLGLGLCYVSQAVRRLGGTLDVFSVPNKGSIFSIFFPLELPPSKAQLKDIPPLVRDARSLLENFKEAGKDSELISPEVLRKDMQHRTKSLFKDDMQLPQRAQESSSKTKVLIVEDDLINAKILQRTFVKEGYEVAWAEDGAIGVDRCKDAEFQLIIMDLMLPNMDGLEATRRIRQLEKETERHPCYIIGFTASTARRVHEDCISVGMETVLTKPMSGKKLLEAVASYL